MDKSKIATVIAILVFIGLIVGFPLTAWKGSDKPSWYQIRSDNMTADISGSGITLCPIDTPYHRSNLTCHLTLWTDKICSEVVPNYIGVTGLMTVFFAIFMLVAIQVNRTDGDVIDQNIGMMMRIITTIVGLIGIFIGILGLAIMHKSCIPMTDQYFRSTPHFGTPTSMYITLIICIIIPISCFLYGSIRLYTAYPEPCHKFGLMLSIATCVLIIVYGAFLQPYGYSNDNVWAGLIEIDDCRGNQCVSIDWPETILDRSCRYMKWNIIPASTCLLLIGLAIVKIISHRSRRCIWLIDIGVIGTGIITLMTCFTWNDTCKPLAEKFMNTQLNRSLGYWGNILLLAICIIYFTGRFIFFVSGCRQNERRIVPEEAQIEGVPQSPVRRGYFLQDNEESV